MMKYNYSKNEMRYILKFISKQAYRKICMSKKRLIDGSIYTPMVAAQMMERVNKYIELKKSQNG